MLEVGRGGEVWFLFGVHFLVVDPSRYSRTLSEKCREIADSGEVVPLTILKYGYSFARKILGSWFVL